MAAAGLRYNRFHVTALCSPTPGGAADRAQSPHGRLRLHRRAVQRLSRLHRLRAQDCAPFPRALQENGYATAAIGKWHMTPDGQPYYLPDDMADKTIEWLHGVRAQDPDKPWFVYFSTGCSHAPHHVPAEWADKYRGRFDQGWDRLREEVFERQKHLGVVPAGAELTPRNEAFPAWDSLEEDQRRLYARQMEVYAGYSENADHNVGRVLDPVEQMGELEDTLVIWIRGDNGSSMAGTLTGSFNELTMQNGIPLTPEQQLALVQRCGGLDVWGSDLIAPHFSAAWAWAGNAPFQWGKQVASHLGGTRNPAVVHWPSRIGNQGAVREHFTHVLDVGPTILEVAGILQPTHVDGIEQEPMHGVSFADSLTDPGAPEHRTQQYFEIFDNRAMYKDGWWLAMLMPRIPWDATPDTMRRFAPGVWDPDSDPAELYYLPDDFTQAQARDLAAEHPEKVAELKEPFWAEAERHKVLPLLGGMSVYHLPVDRRYADQSPFAFDDQDEQALHEHAHQSRTAHGMSA
jgi:arylsulfatase A-like enzyme